MKKKEETLEKISEVITYVVFDKKTGRVVHTHRRFDVEKEAYCECDPEDVRGLIGSDDFILGQVTKNDPRNLDVIMTTEITDKGSTRDRGFIVNTKTRKVIEMPILRLTSEKSELEGDGKDRTIIEIEVVNSEGKIAGSYNEIVKITTNRGKLSARGGLVKLKRGRGKITLISANETVDRVSVMAQCLDGTCVMAHLALEFI